MFPIAKHHGFQILSAPTTRAILLAISFNTLKRSKRIQNDKFTLDVECNMW